MLTIGQKLYATRVQRDITQTELAERTGLTQANISNVEKGKQDITVSTLIRICCALDLRPAEVFEDKPSEGGKPVFDRPTLERIARSVVTGKPKLSGDEERIVRLLRDLVPGGQTRTLPDKRLHVAWSELRRYLSDEEVNVLNARVQDALQRRQ